MDPGYAWKTVMRAMDSVGIFWGTAHMPSQELTLHPGAVLLPSFLQTSHGLF